MENMKKLWILTIILVSGFIVNSCGGNEDNSCPTCENGQHCETHCVNENCNVHDCKNHNVIACDECTPKYTVTFISNSGTNIDQITGLTSGTTITAPTDPTRDNDVPGLYYGTPPDYIFVEWRKPNGTAWDFVTDSVIADITLTAIWIAPVPIADVMENDITSAITYMNTNTGIYTLLINQNVNADNQNFNVDNVNLTIIGIDEECSIQYNGAVNRQLFFIVANNTSLTLGNNITLKGIENSTINLIRVDAGSLIMKNGSKITGHLTTTLFGTVRFQGENSHFIMEGGEISGNISTSGSENSAAVRVQLGASFVMSGGIIINNFRNTNIPSDVRIINEHDGYPEYPQTSFIQTGGTIGVTLIDPIM